MTNMKQRLTELLWDKQVWGVGLEQPIKIENSDIANHLVNNGVIVLPCKIGDTLYDIFEIVANGEGEIKKYKVDEINIQIDKRGGHWLKLQNILFPFNDFNEVLFLSLEEAKARLAKGE